MDIWHATLAAAALSLVLWRREWRVSAWTGLAALCFVIPDQQRAISLTLANGLADASSCVLLYFFGRYKWELRLWIVWQTSLLISVLAALGGVLGPNHYVIGMELCNWLALVVMAWPWGRRVSAVSFGPVRRASDPLLAERRAHGRDADHPQRVSDLSLRTGVAMEAQEGHRHGLDRMAAYQRVPHRGREASRV